MLRLVCGEAGQVWPDVLQKAPGRGAYLCWNVDCLGRLRDGNLHAAWKNRDIAPGQTAELSRRSAVALLRLCRQYVHRQRPGLKVGRDAVMHRMWNQMPVFILLAGDAGDALKRQVREACVRRIDNGLKTVLIFFAGSAVLGGILKRGKVSVLAVDDTPANEKLRQCCARYERLQEWSRI